MQNPGSTTFWRHTYSLNLADCRRRGLASRFAWPGRLFGTLAAALLAITVANRVSADEVARWNQIATDASTVANTNPLTESCAFSILHIAIHDAVNAVESRYEPYLPRTSPAPGASVEAAIASAAHATLIALLPASKVSFDAALEETLRTVSDDSRKTAGLEVGRAAAAAILAARENDGEKRTVQYTPGTKSGEYRPTPPDFISAFNVHWGSVTPFVLKSSAQFRPAEPPAVNSLCALADIEEVKAIGGSKSVTRTAEQSEIARYWHESSPRGWNRIAREVSAARPFDAWENARLFALVNLAMADGYIANFESKYHYNYWRPITAIRERGDSEWLSTTAKVNVDSQGVILKGYDAVAYFKYGKPLKGNPEIKSSYQGATYLFTSAENKADFDKDPAKSTPQYGGFCAYGVTYGVLADIEGPDGFVYNGKLYVCGNKDAEESFRTDLDSNIEKADTNWQKLSGS